MATDPVRSEGFDRAAAVTRSLLGYGVVAGPLYLAIGIVLALTRDGFELARHPLSLLMLGEHGWIQRANLAVAGLMTIAAAVGFARSLRGSRAASRAGLLLGIYGGGLILGSVFAPDPMAGFPPGSTGDVMTLSGMLHFGFGVLAFLAMAAAAIVVGGWFAARSLRRWALASRLAGVVMIVSFVGGAALATTAVGALPLWVTVVTGWAWLVGVSLRLYQTVPHPDVARR